MKVNENTIKRGSKTSSGNEAQTDEILAAGMWNWRIWGSPEPDRKFLVVHMHKKESLWIDCVWKVTLLRSTCLRLITCYEEGTGQDLGAYPSTPAMLSTACSYLQCIQLKGGGRGGRGRKGNYTLALTAVWAPQQAPWPPPWRVCACGRSAVPGFCSVRCTTCRGSCLPVGTPDRGASPSGPAGRRPWQNLHEGGEAHATLGPGHRHCSLHQL